MQETGKYSDPIGIRAHHLLCIQGFQGFGYSKDFELHLESFVVFLNLNPSFKIQILAETDEICSHCPYEIQGACEKVYGSLDETLKVDYLVIGKLDLNLKQFYSVEYVTKLVNNRLDWDDVIEICFNCSWKDKCLFYLEKV